MNKVILRTYFLIVFLSACIVFSCTNVELPPPESPEFCNDIIATYITNVQPIIDESCAYSGCHKDVGGIGNYSSYNGMIPYLNEGTFRKKVLELKNDPIYGMPPDKSANYPNSQKDDLTEEELQIIECWLNSGYPRD